MVILKKIPLIVALFGLVSYNDSPASEQVLHGWMKGYKSAPVVSRVFTVFLLLDLFCFNKIIYSRLSIQTGIEEPASRQQQKVWV